MNLIRPSRYPQLLCLVSCLMVYGCGSSTTDVDAYTELSDGDIAEQAPQIVASATKTLELLRSSGGPGRVQVFRHEVAQGHALAQRLVDSSNAEYQRVGHQARANLMRVEALYNRDEAAKIEEAVRVANQDDARGPAAEMMRAAWLRWQWIDTYVDSDGAPANRPTAGEVVPSMTEFIADFPESDVAAQLLADVTRHFVSEQELDQAQRLFAKLESAFPESAALEPLREKIAQLTRANARRVHAIEARTAYVDAIVEQALDGQRQGYFLLFSKEVPEDGRRVGLVPCRYTVLHGVDEVADHIRNALLPNWEWDVIGHFPDTRSGRRAALRMWEDVNTRYTSAADD